MIDLNALPSGHRNKYSQSGEELIVATFHNVVLRNVENVSMCEFGAHDGSNSNLLALWEEGCASLIFIECDSLRYKILANRYPSSSNLVVIHDRVGWTGSGHIFEVCERNSVPLDQIRIWSIDVDGDDIYIFKTIPQTADLIIVEYNPTIPFDTQSSNPPHKNIGSSPLSLCEVAQERGMFLAAITETNLIFIDNRHSHQFQAHNLSEIKPHRNSLRLAMGYDGTLIRIGGDGEDLTDEVLNVGWSLAFYVQPLPKFLRKFNRYQKSKLMFSAVRLAIARPLLIPNLVKKYQTYRTTKSKLIHRPEHS